MAVIMPPLVESLMTTKRNLADWMPTPLGMFATVKRRNAMRVSLPPTVESWLLVAYVLLGVDWRT